jgi:hypothetical protein
MRGGVTMTMSIGERATRLSVAVATALIGITLGLPLIFEMNFDRNLAHYPAAASVAQRDPELRQVLLRQTEAAFIRGGWRAANAAVGMALATQLEPYADDEHVLAMTRTTLRVLGKLKATPSDCKAFLLVGVQSKDDFQAARPELDEFIALHNAAFQNGFDRKSQGVTWRQPPDDAILNDDRSLAMQPVPLSSAELQALAKYVDGDATQYCSARIKLQKNLLSKDPSEAARIEREHIYLTDRIDWVKVLRTLCREQMTARLGENHEDDLPRADDGAGRLVCT